MGKLLQGCAVAALVGAMGGQAFAQTQSVYIRSVPVMAAPALAPRDEWAGPPDTPLPPGMRDGTLDAQYVRIQAARTADGNATDANATDAPVAEGAAEARVVEARGADVPVADTRDHASPVPTPVADQAPAAPTFDIAPRIFDAASAFDDYMTAAAQLRGQFADGGQVAKAVDIGAGYEAHQLEAGAIAYAALVALHDPFFVAHVRALDEDPRDLAQRLVASPQTIMRMSGADRTAATVAAVLRARGGEVFGAGKAVKQSAYDVQRQPWSRAFVADPQAVLARVKSNSSQVARADDARVQRLMGALPSMSALQPGDGERSGIVTKGLALAALTVVGQAGAANADQFDPLLSDAFAAGCLKMAKLNLYQCMAVAGPQYEDLYCVGQHGMMDTGACMISAADDANGAPPLAIRTADAAGDQELTERQAIERGYAH